jgi:hypothetical protein
MSESGIEEKTEAASTEQEPKRPYAPPAIVWREPYDPISFGISCAKQPGNPPCVGLSTA